jgi:hypothetical protein
LLCYVALGNRTIVSEVSEGQRDQMESTWVASGKSLINDGAFLLVMVLNPTLQVQCQFVNWTRVCMCKFLPDFLL